MITFLPVENFQECAGIIDNKRLWKNILETEQVYKIITNQINGGHYKLHPVVKMWHGFEKALLQYREIFIQEWLNRRLSQAPKLLGRYYPPINIYPEWINDKRIYSSHRAALLAKNYEYYKQFNWKEEPKICYYWPR